MQGGIYVGPRGPTWRSPRPGRLTRNNLRAGNPKPRRRPAKTDTPTSERRGRRDPRPARRAPRRDGPRASRDPRRKNQMAPDRRRCRASWAYRSSVSPWTAPGSGPMIPADHGRRRPIIGERPTGKTTDHHPAQKKEAGRVASGLFFQTPFATTRLRSGNRPAPGHVAERSDANRFLQTQHGSSRRRAECEPRHPGRLRKSERPTR
jgi:hypothetical protein